MNLNTKFKLFTITCLLSLTPHLSAFSNFNPLNEKEATAFYEGFNLALRGLNGKEFKIQGMDEQEVKFNEFMVVVDATGYDNAKRFALQTIGLRYDDSVRVTFNNWVVLSSFDRRADASTLAKRINDKYLAEQPKNRRCFVYEKKLSDVFYKEKSFYHEIATFMEQNLKNKTKILYYNEPRIINAQPVKKAYPTTLPLTHEKPKTQLKPLFPKNNNAQSSNKSLPPPPSSVSQEKKDFDLKIALSKKREEALQKRLNESLKALEIANEARSKEIIAPVEDSISQLNRNPLVLDAQTNGITKKATLYHVILKEPNTMPVSIPFGLNLNEVSKNDLQFASSIPNVSDYISSRKIKTTDSKEVYYLIDDLNVWVNEEKIFIEQTN